MQKLTDREKTFCWAIAQGADPADAYRECFKTGRWKPETIESKALALLKQEKVTKRIEADTKKADLVDRHKAGIKAMEVRPRLEKAERHETSKSLQPANQNDEVFAAAMAKAFGSDDFAFYQCLSTQAANMIPGKGDVDPITLNGIYSAIAGIGPRDELEGMLATQMVAIHFASIEATRRAAVDGQTLEARNMNLKHAGQLMRTFTQQMESLNRYRGKGQQKMTVEHVHVHNGGQAIVGTVNHATGGGAEAEMKGQPHEQEAVTHAPISPMRREEPARDAVPSASDEERAVPSARRQSDGRSKG